MEVLPYLVVAAVWFVCGFWSGKYWEKRHLSRLIEDRLGGKDSDV